MEKNNGTEIQVNPPLQPPPSVAGKQQIDLYANRHLYNYYGYANNSVYYSQPQNPNSHFPDQTAQTQPPPPGIDPAPAPQADLFGYPSGYKAQALAYSPPHPIHLHPAFAPDVNQIIAMTSCSVDLYADGDIVSSTGIQNLASPSQRERPKVSKKAPKKIKIVQSVWCEVCRVDCNSKNVLDQHKLGKKHKKNLEKLIVANKSVLTPSVLASVPSPASTVSDKPLIGPEDKPLKATSVSNLAIGPQENPVKDANNTSGQVVIAENKAAGTDDLETKRKKMVEGGTAADAVRMCEICNIVCNSETVFVSHLAGQKHAAKVRRKQANAIKIGS